MDFAGEGVFGFVEFAPDFGEAEEEFGGFLGGFHGGAGLT
jgi:hypothetical protein